MLYVLLYDVVERYAERRVPVRERHLAHALQARERGELLYGGAFGGPAPDDGLEGRCSSSGPTTRPWPSGSRGPTRT